MKSKTKKKGKEVIVYVHLYGGLIEDTQVFTTKKKLENFIKTTPNIEDEDIRKELIEEWEYTEDGFGDEFRIQWSNID